MKKRDTHRYELKQGNALLYVGISNDPERRIKEHENSKEFGQMKIIGPACSRESAEKWETERLDKYRRNHSGNNPKYNRKMNGH